MISGTNVPERPPGYNEIHPLPNTRLLEAVGGGVL